MSKEIQIGFACKIVDEAVPNIKTLILRRLNPENLRAIVRANIETLHAQFAYLEANGLRVFRICSDVVPFGSSPAMPIDWRVEFGSAFADLGRCARERGLRLSLHPGQFTVLNSPLAGVVEASLADVEYHVALLDSMGMDESCKVVLHAGGVYGDKTGAIEAFARNYARLSEAARARVVLENDHNRFHAADVLGLCARLGCPMVLDLHHDLLLPRLGTC